MRVVIAIACLCACHAVAAAQETFVEFRICPKERLFADDSFYPYTVTTGRTIPFRVWRLWYDESRGTYLVYRRENLAPTSVGWSSDAPAVADVDAQGVVTTKARGDARITGKDAEGRSHTVALKVIDPKDASVDLCVAYVSRFVKDPKGREYRLSRYFGKLAEDSGGALRSPDPLEPEQNYPDPGQIVVWRAHLINDGQRDAGPVTVVWKVDGTEQKREAIRSLPVAGLLAPTGRFADTESKCPILALEGEKTVDFELKNDVRDDQPWRPARHEVTVELIGPDGVKDDNPDNNTLAFQTDAIVFGYYFSETPYLDVSAANLAGPGLDAYPEVVQTVKDGPWKDELDIRSTTGYDYVQRQTRIANKLFAAARYPLLPDGITERLRVEVWIVADLEKWGPRGAWSPVVEKDIDIAYVNTLPESGWSAMTGMRSILVHDLQGYWAAQDLLRWMGLNRYLTIGTGPNMSRQAVWPHDVLVKDADGSPIYPEREGPSFVPYERERRHRLASPVPTQPSYPTLFQWNEHEAYALDRIAGRRARGAAGYEQSRDDRSEYCNDIAERHGIVVRDPSGAPLEGVTVEMIIPSGTQYEDKVGYAATTDSRGRAPLPPNPLHPDPPRYPSSGLHARFSPNRMAHASDAALIRLWYQGKTFYKWLTTYDANFAYWYAYGFKIDRWPYPNDPDCEPEGNWTRPRDTVSAYIYTIDPNWTAEQEFAARDEAPRLGVEPDARPGEFSGPVGAEPDTPGSG